MENEGSTWCHRSSHLQSSWSSSDFFFFTPLNRGQRQDFTWKITFNLTRVWRSPTQAKSLIEWKRKLRSNRVKMVHQVTGPVNDRVWAQNTTSSLICVAGLHRLGKMASSDAAASMSYDSEHWYEPGLDDRDSSLLIIHPPLWNQGGRWCDLTLDSSNSPLTHLVLCMRVYIWSVSIVDGRIHPTVTNSS